MRTVLRKIFHARARRRHRYQSRMLFGLPRPPRPDYLAGAGAACRAYLKLARLMARDDPENLDWAIVDRLARQREQQRLLEQQVNIAVEKIYGKT